MQYTYPVQAADRVIEQLITTQENDLSHSVSEEPKTADNDMQNEFIIEDGSQNAATEIIQSTPQTDFEIFYGTIERYYGQAREVVIPDTINGQVVTSISYDAFKGCSSIESIQIPGTIKVIGNRTFNECINLKQVILKEGVKNINYQAFYNCINLVSVDIPDTVTDIGQEAFAGCSSLRDITLPESLERIGYSAFYQCRSLENIDIPGTVKVIEHHTFAGADQLFNVSFQEGATSIGAYAFEGCSNLVSINLPDTITTIEHGAFSGCSSLMNIELPKKLERLGYNAFSQCSSLERINIPETLSILEANTFRECSNLVSVILPNAITAIRHGVFAECKNLREIELPKLLKKIESSTFSNCTILEKVSMPDTIEGIAIGAFEGCYKVTYLTIDYGEKDITNIGYEEWEKVLNQMIDVNKKNVAIGYIKNSILLKQVTDLYARVIDVKAEPGNKQYTTRLVIKRIIGNNIILKISDTKADVPMMGTEPPMGSKVIDNYINGSDIQGVDLTSNRYIEVYETNPNKKVVGFACIELMEEDIANRDKVDAAQSEVYKILDQAVCNEILTVDLTSYLEEIKNNNLDIRNIVEDILNNRYGGFFPGWPTFYLSHSDSLVYKVSFTYRDMELARQRRSEFEAAVEKVIGKFSNASTDIEKVLMVHDYLVLNTAYDYENYKNNTIPAVSYTAYGVLVKGIGVSYAEAAKILLNKVGIPCEVVNGTYLGVPGYTWNIVTVDGQNYHLDCKGDDPVPDVPGRVMYKYFNLSDKEMKNSGRGWEASLYPTCDDESYAFVKDFRESVTYKDTCYYIDSRGKLYKISFITKQKQLLDESSCLNLKLDQESLRISYDYIYANYETYDYEKRNAFIDLVPEAAREFSQNFVSRFYRECMGREADEQGKNYWAQKLLHVNFSGADLAKNFIYSPEFVQKDLSPEDYISIMYRVFFDRTADEGGLSFWKEKLSKGITKDYVLAGFINSEEFKQLCSRYGIQRGDMELTNPLDLYPSLTEFTYRFYEKCMDRMPDRGGLAYWVEGLSAQAFTGSQMAEFFVFSEEFTSKSLSDEAFVSIMYRVFFGREADQGGKAYWLQRLSNRSVKKDVFEDFVYSAEFLGICSRYNIRHH